eukprot:TRINITY_DN5838_c0_g1_i1.p1 TRINITY_DN5838_c0_g1~~TRINITY_DN5838_c0_g1_i1.p1  ORF type:complete len:607 (+),score=91.00 TRINITY_DN5838_c0_g1_i1:212-1822(+)
MPQYVTQMPGQALVQMPLTVSKANPQDIERIREFLKVRDILKGHVVKAFRASVALGANDLDGMGLLRFRDLFVQATGVPSQAVEGLAASCEQFDFSGTGRLELNEVYKLVKFKLRAWQKDNDDVVSAVTVPVKSVAQAGYRIIKQIGEGSQGVVCLAQNSQGRELCLKTFKKAAMSPLAFDDLKDEFETMQLLSCERISQAFEIFQDHQFYYLSGEAYYGGDFSDLRENALRQGVQLTEDYWKVVFKQCFEGLLFMHEQAMMHCDIKEANMMLKSKDYHRPEVVLIDFGVSKAMAKNSDGLCGTPGYIPPETWDLHKWIPRGDVFSLGVVMLQMIADKLPPKGQRFQNTPGGIFIEGCMTHDEIANATRTRAAPMYLMSRYSPPLTSLVQATLSKQVVGRPTPARALESAWFQQVCAVPQVISQGNSAGNSQAPGGGKTNRGRHAFATVGITKSFIANFDNTEETGNEAMLALREVVQTAGQVQAQQMYVPPVNPSGVTTDRLSPGVAARCSPRVVQNFGTASQVPRVQFASYGGI